MISFNDYKGINSNKVNEYKKELESFEGYIPSILYFRVSISNHLRYLKNENPKLYDDVNKIRKKRRRELKASENKYEYRVKELIDWVNENPQYSDIIITKK